MRKMVVVIGLIGLLGCSSAYYGTMEKLGYHKRDLMVNRVESARDAQEEAKAIASLQTELGSVEAEVNSLIKDMEASIKEADAFISAMAKE